LDLKDHLAQRARLVLGESLVDQGMTEAKGLRVLGEWMDVLDLRVNPDYVESLVRQGLAVNKACADLAAATVPLAVTVSQAWLAGMEQLARQASEGLKAQRDLQARQERTERLVQRGVPEHLARKEIAVIRETPGRKG
jgi:hypothetical protein